MDMTLAGKTALVTGGNTGIGRAVCLAYADAGADLVVAWYDDEDAAEATARDVRARGRRALTIHCDVTSEASVTGLWSAAVDHFGGVDILVNNAGIQQRVPVVET